MKPEIRKIIRALLRSGRTASEITKEIDNLLSFDCVTIDEYIDIMFVIAKLKYMGVID